VVASCATLSYTIRLPKAPQCAPQENVTCTYPAMPMCVWQEGYKCMVDNRIAKCDREYNCPMGYDMKLMNCGDASSCVCAKGEYLVAEVGGVPENCVLG
jgi:hypothetical protein